jgi:hypothetical protein
VIYPVDSVGNICGIKNQNLDLSGSKYLAFFNASNSNSFKKCVASCPDPSKSKLLCKYGIAPQSEQDKAIALSNGSCVDAIKTKEVFFLCFPDQLDLAATSVLQQSWRSTLLEELRSFSTLSLFYNQLLYMWKIIAL